MGVAPGGKVPGGSPGSVLIGQQGRLTWLLGKYRGQLLGRLDAHLLVHVHAAKHHLDVGHGHAKLRRQKTQHVVGRLARHRGGGHADLELRALGLADDVACGTGLAQNVDHQHVAVPGKKGIAGDVFDLAAAHATLGGRCNAGLIGAVRVMFGMVHR